MSPSNRFFNNRTDSIKSTYNKLQNQKLPKGSELQIRTPKVDMCESSQSYLIRLSIPGVKKEDVKIIFSNNSIEIKGVVRSVLNQDYENLIIQEIYQGPFMRKIDLPETIDKTKVQFSYHGGILEVIIPKILEDRS